MPSSKDLEQNNVAVEKHILEAIRGIKYGAVEVLIHDSRIVQIEKTEKLRFDVSKLAN
jgi:hypothetical protein